MEGAQAPNGAGFRELFQRERFAAFLSELNITQPRSGTATSREEARAVAKEIGFPVVVRPSYVLGGRAMAIVYDTATLDRYMKLGSWFAGTPQQLVEHLKKLEARFPGMEHINLSTSLGTPKAVMLEQFQWVAEEVMPAFKPASVAAQ